MLRPDLTIAYTDTDGHGQRGDRRPPSSEKFYGAVDAAIRQATGKPRDQTVVLTADYSFLSYYPYWGFQGLTSHYANPLAQFDQRAAQIKQWAKLKTADEFIHALDTLPWPPPTVFLMRRPARATPTPCGWPRMSIPTSPTFVATPSNSGRAVRRPAVRRDKHRPIRAGHSQTRLMATETSPDTVEELRIYLRERRGGKAPDRPLRCRRRRSAGHAAGDRHPGAAGQPDHRATELATERDLQQRRGATDRLRGHRPERQRALPGGRRTGRTAEREQDGAVVDGAQAGPQSRRPRSAHPARQRRPGAGGTQCRRWSPPR